MMRFAEQFFEIEIDDNQLICILTDEIKPSKAKEIILQSLIAMLNEEYGFRHD